MRIEVHHRDERQDQRIWDVIADLIKTLKSISNNLNILHDQVQVVDHKVSTLINQEIVQMASLADTLAAVQAESTAVGSLVTLVQGLKSQLDDVLSGKLDAASQAQVDAIFAEATSEKDAVVAAVQANTPTAQPTSPVQPVDPNAPTA